MKKTTSVDLPEYIQDFDNNINNFLARLADYINFAFQEFIRELEKMKENEKEKKEGKE